MPNITKQKKNKKFKGFPPTPARNYWPYPRAMDEWWHTLNGSEQKCLDYILRHTWGFKKSADAISISQFVSGVKNLDKGTGLSKGTVIGALRGLGRKGFIELDGLYRKTKRYQLVQRLDTGSVGSGQTEGSVTKPSDSAGNRHTTTDSTTKDITIKDNQTLITLKGDVIPLYICLIAHVFKLSINKNTDVDSRNIRPVVYGALKEYGPRALLRAIGNKGEDERWLELNDRRSIIWFIGHKTLPSWIEERSDLRLGGGGPFSYSFKFLRPEERAKHPVMKILKEIVEREGKENLQQIFKGYEVLLQNL